MLPSDLLAALGVTIVILAVTFVCLLASRLNLKRRTRASAAAGATTAKRYPGKPQPQRNPI